MVGKRLKRWFVSNVYSEFSSITENGTGSTDLPIMTDSDKLSSALIMVGGLIKQRATGENKSLQNNLFSTFPNRERS